MKIIARLAAAFLVAALCAGPACGGDLPPGLAWNLVTNRSVLHELAVDEGQARAIRALVPVLKGRYAARLGAARDLPAAGRDAESHAAMVRFDAELRAMLRQVLEPGQVARFEQLVLRSTGLAAFTLDRVRGELRATGEQETRLAGLLERVREAHREAREFVSNDDREAAFERMFALSRRLVADVEAAMTPEQRAAWAKLAGEPFELEEDPTVEQE